MDAAALAVLFDPSIEVVVAPKTANYKDQLLVEWFVCVSQTHPARAVARKGGNEPRLRGGEREDAEDRTRKRERRRLRSARNNNTLTLGLRPAFFFTADTWPSISSRVRFTHGSKSFFICAL